jgi:hypothetical protein
MPANTGRAVALRLCRRKPGRRATRFHTPWSSTFQCSSYRFVLADEVYPSVPARSSIATKDVVASLSSLRTQSELRTITIGKPGRDGLGVWLDPENQLHSESGMGGRSSGGNRSIPRRDQGLGPASTRTLSTNVLHTPPPPLPLHISCCCGRLSDLLTLLLTPIPTPAVPPVNYDGLLEQHIRPSHTFSITTTQPDNTGYYHNPRRQRFVPNQQWQALRALLSQRAGYLRRRTKKKAASAGTG